MNAPPTDPRTTGRAVPAQRQPPTLPPREPPRQRHDVLDVNLHDAELQAEMELTALLMIAVNDATESEGRGPLSQTEIDRLLGLA